jgi:prepilin-type N-terminal cleavage/methylation domain-containing protein
MKKGFTLIEILIAASILIIVMALTTFLYVKAANMQQDINYQRDVGGVINEMFKEILYGTSTLTGATQADSCIVAQASLSPTYNFEYTTSSGTKIYYYKIAIGLYSNPQQPNSTGTGTDTTLWQASGTTSLPPADSSGWTSLDFNKKVILQPGSQFQYFNYANTLLNGAGFTDANFVDTATSVTITLIGASTSPGLKTRPSSTYTTSVRMKNKPSF